MPALIEEAEDRTLQRAVDDWEARLNALIPTHVDGQTPEGFEPLRRLQYMAGSVRIEELELDPDTDRPRLTVAFRARSVELTGDGFTGEELEGFVEIPVREDDTLDLSQVSFLDALYEREPD